MATTAPIVDEAADEQAVRAEAPHELPGRIERLEGELAELRDTVARFAEMIIGEVKVLRNSHAELPILPPPGMGEGAINPGKTNGTDSTAGPDQAGAPHRPWLLAELLRDFGTTVRMYLDPRYRVRRATQMLVPLILGLFALNFFFFHYVFQIPFVSVTLEKLADIVLAILLYRVVSQELVRYRQTISHLLAWQDYRQRPSAAVFNSEPPMTQLETD